MDIRLEFREQRLRCFGHSEIAEGGEMLRAAVQYEAQGKGRAADLGSHGGFPL